MIEKLFKLKENNTDIKINKNALIFSYLEEDNNTLKNLLNTNIIDNNRLVFSIDYINNNFKLIKVLSRR